MLYTLLKYILIIYFKIEVAMPAREYVEAGLK